jgi:hypothetical protein
MLRSEIIASVEKLVGALSRASIQRAIEANDPKLTLFAYHSFAEIYANPTRGDQHLLHVFQLNPLLQIEWWADALAGTEDRGPDRSDRPQPDRVRREEVMHDRATMHARVRFASEKLPAIVELIKTELEEAEPTVSRIILLVPESAEQTSSPIRIIGAIESIILFYAALCKIHNDEENTLALRSCDSGSDKSFDFTGLPQIIEQVKSVIFGIIDRIIFFREMKYTERVKRVAESLPILDQIAQMVEAKKLSPEQAELLRRDFIEGATKFLETGSMIPELNNRSRYEAGSLIQASPRLLLEGPANKRKSPTVEEKGETQKSRRQKRSPAAPESEGFGDRELEEFVASREALSEDDRRELFELLKKRRQ